MLARFFITVGIVWSLGVAAQVHAHPFLPEPAEIPYPTTIKTEALVYLNIPAASIFTAITDFELNGVSWEIDPWESLAGHLEGTANLNQGNMVIAGHAEYPDGTPGIFYQLANIPTGSTITIQSGEETHRFVIIEIRSVDYRDLSVVYPTLENRLTLITCDIPSYDASTRSYDSRLVIIAEPIKP
jgi:LPXTG-site transpeptidase (sortase) family protein